MNVGIGALFATLAAAARYHRIVNAFDEGVTSWHPIEPGCATERRQYDTDTTWDEYSDVLPEDDPPQQEEGEA